MAVVATVDGSAALKERLEACAAEVMAEAMKLAV